MNPHQIVYIILLGLWAPLTILVALYFTWRRLESRRRERLEFDMKMMDRDVSRRSEFEIERFQNELRSSIEFLVKSFDSKMEDLGPRIRQAVETPVELVRSEFSLLRMQIEAGDRALMARAQEPVVLNNGSDNAPLIREVSHALNTPLSQMEAALLTLEAEGDDIQQAGIQDGLKGILTGLQACKSIIAGFRESILSAKSAGTWSPVSLQEAVQSITQMNIDAKDADIRVDAHLPEEVTGFSNNYLIAVLLPLIENAIDSGKDGSELVISSRKDGTHLCLDVTSEPDALPVSNQIYADGFSTKPGHTGTGLSIVRRLLTGRAGAALAHSIVANRVTFTITLPSGS